MEMFVGKLDKIRMINNDPLMARFTVNLPKLKINCITSNGTLANKILMLPDGKYDVKVIGRFNKRKQLVVRAFEVINPDDMIKRLGI